VRRLWSRDASLWTGADEASWLGWLGIAGDQLARVSALRDLAVEIRGAGLTHAVVLGMGGSSLCPQVLTVTFGRMAGYPELFVLDSTNPGQILAPISRWTRRTRPSFRRRGSQCGTDSGSRRAWSSGRVI
jgi:transaldolase / glucose-6-phosphate isomerase